MIYQDRLYQVDPPTFALSVRRPPAVRWELVGSGPTRDELKEFARAYYPEHETEIKPWITPPGEAA